MGGAFEPKSVEPGWASRWTRQAASLMARRPISSGATAVALFVVALINQWGGGAFGVPRITVEPFVSILAMAWVYALMWASDHSDTDVLGVFLKCAADVFQMLRALIVLGFVAMWALYQLEHSVLSALTAAAGSVKAAGALPVVNASASWPPLIQRLVATILGDQSATTYGIFPLALYVAMSVGYAGFSPTLMAAAHAFQRNFLPVLIFGALCYLPPDLMTQFVALYAPPVLAIFFAICMSVLTVFFCASWYIACREIFEGRRENRPVSVGLVGSHA